MAHKKRLCRRSSRGAGRSADLNYSTDKAYKKAKRRRQLEKAGRKAARRRR